MIPLDFIDAGRKFSDHDLADAEFRIGRIFPQDLKKIYRLSNGGYPDRQYHADAYNEIWFQKLLPIEVKPLPEDEVGLIETMEKLKKDKTIPDGWIVFGMDPGANLFACQTVVNGMWYMPMDEWNQAESAKQNWDRSSKRVAQSIGDFFDGLQEESPF
jgi:hypothetical protein